MMACGGAELCSRNLKACVQVENCDADVVGNFFRAVIEGGLRHREGIEEHLWRIAGENEDEGGMDAIDQTSHQI